ncbi:MULTISPECIES: Flp family type IVb pilin [Bacteria]|jgi:pilus assembly protein Flp/PilA|uniref:Flp family type IVb pilin n=2 Tax=Burkholderia contaminans TaxID=488447 RepID=A0A1E3FX60_9BURK|nr:MULTISPECIES: Flp family type IVb pilin [Burkholderia]UTP27536.1 Flp family type IVb pilin [Burkholderia sp. FXe9]KKL42884.1 pilus assembly protein [Burkholderia contaminans LMG 23361]MBA9829092.1 Flp family type IVb pilin [Burkholderia contaminans]MBA9838011.1 Flp family type IVb pilin [Burkholderia contaminans]MBA9862510.1 Flp family type IVb pilin [Burkholderia contaminans]
MSRIIEKIAWLVEDQGGVTAIEYGLIAALIAIGIVAALTTVGTDLKTVFSTVADDLDSIVAAI